MLMIDLENNFYSATSLYAVILQILVMMLDRFFYIKGHLLGKVVFHIIYSILIMIYLFIGIPYTTNTSFGSKDSVVFFTILQMLYIILSSLQISHGYPTSDNFINNIINKNYSIFNRVLFYVSLFILFDFSAIDTSPSSSKSTKFSTGPSATLRST
ncbi:uncharacterized protein [Blastocystis hominis]|uniref:Piezo THU9 and anchor domain-containing protein n=1 Tax=Blastocystis hominis TaxID=12968 RepID=D8M4J5_BLAHO|nr:uncharacterized protein [Blastocystis hominis]CBK22984.2 unnamed protein product [Blastocystis hominis]|eukprot:XP_012897032.1 uncharacterized protein [Blastocystis hominis]